MKIKVKSIINDLNSSADGGGDIYNGSTESVLVSASDSYSDDEEILVVL